MARSVLSKFNEPQGVAKGGDVSKMDETVRLLVRGLSVSVCRQVMEDLVERLVDDGVVTEEEAGCVADDCLSSRGGNCEVYADMYLKGGKVARYRDAALRWMYVGAMCGSKECSAGIASAIASFVARAVVRCEVVNATSPEWVAEAAGVAVWWAARGDASLSDGDYLLLRNDMHQHGSADVLKGHIGYAAAYPAPGTKEAELLAKANAKDGWGIDEGPDFPGDDIGLVDLDFGIGPKTHRVCKSDVEVPAAGARGQGDIAKLAVLATDLPVPESPDPDMVEALLTEEFPYAAAAVSMICKDIRAARRWGVTSLHFKPLILVGPPGTGKSRLARRVAELAEAPFAVVGCAGMADNRAVHGTSRGYATGGPSLFARTLATAKSSGGVFVFDEIDKSSQEGGRNGSVAETLLSVLEPMSPFQDDYLESELDLRWCSFVLTANSLANLNPALLSRCRSVEVPPPDVGHVRQVAESIVSELAREWSVDRRWLPPLDGIEVKALEDHYRKTRSVRALRRAVEKVVDLRERNAMTH